MVGKSKLDRRGSGPIGSSCWRSSLYGLFSLTVARDHRRRLRRPRQGVADLPARVGVPGRPATSGDGSEPRPLVRARRRPPRRGLPPLLVHQGHRAGGRRSSSTRSGCEPGMRVLDVGCGPGRHAHALAGRGIEVVGVDISQRFVDLATEAAPPGRDVPAGRRPRARLRRRVRRRHLALPGRLRPHRRARARRSTATAPCSQGWPGPCARAAGWRCRPSRPTSSCATSRTTTASTPTPG